MSKIFQYILLFIIVISIGYVYLKISNTRAQIIPVPFELPEVSAKEITKASRAQILLIGDQSSETLKPSISRIIESFDEEFKDKIKVFDWTRPNEGVHRTYHKLKSLPKIPQIVL